MPETKEIFKAPPEPTTLEEVKELEENFVPDKEADLSYTREQLVEDLKRGFSDIRSEVFDEISKSFNIETDSEKKVAYVFHLGGHKITAYPDDTLSWLMDGGTLNKQQTKAMKEKYGPLLFNIAGLDKGYIDRQNFDSIVEGLLR